MDVPSGNRKTSWNTTHMRVSSYVAVTGMMGQPTGGGSVDMVLSENEISPESLGLSPFSHCKWLFGVYLIFNQTMSNPYVFFVPTLVRRNIWDSSIPFGVIKHGWLIPEQWLGKIIRQWWSLPVNHLWLLERSCVILATMMLYHIHIYNYIYLFIIYNNMNLWGLWYCFTVL